MKTITKLSLIALLLCGFTFAKAQVPPTAPPDLTYPAEDVLSFISEKYGEAFPTMATIWEPPSSWNYTGTGDDQSIVVIRNLDWLPIALNGNASLKDYTYVHVDVFCNVNTKFRIGFHSHYPDNKEQYFPMIEEGTMEPGKWYSIDYSIDDFFLDGWEGNRAANYLRFGGNMPGESNVYANEIYVTNFVLFNGEPTCLDGCIIEPPAGLLDVKESVPVPFNVSLAVNTLNCNSVETIKDINVYSVAGQIVGSVSNVNADSYKFDTSNLTSGAYIVSAKFANGAVSTKRIIK